MSGTVALLGAPALLAVAALLTWTAGTAGLRPGRLPVAVATWAALALFAVQWMPSRAVVEAGGPGLGSGATLAFRLDAAGFAAAVAVLVAVGLLVTFQRRGWRSSGSVALLATVALLAVLADGMVMTAFCWGTLATVALVTLRAEDQRGSILYWGWLFAAQLAIVATSGLLVVAGGTSRFSALPVNAVGAVAAYAAAAAGLAAAGLLPWRPWPVIMAARPRPEAASVVYAATFPLGILLLLRLLGASAGNLPGRLGLALLVAGIVVAAGAAVRAQAASAREDLEWEAIACMGGLAVAGIGIGTPTGVAGAVLVVLSVTVTAAAVSFMPARRLELPILAALAGMPPLLGFGGLVLVVEAAYEQSARYGLAGVVIVITWALLVAAVARGRSLPRRRGSGVAAPPAGTFTAVLILVLGGLGSAALAAFVAVPAAVQVTSGQLAPSASAASIASAAGTWAPLAAGIPAALLLAAAAYAISRRPAPEAERAPAPLFALPLSGLRTLTARLAAARLPETYQSLLNPRAVEAAMARGQPVLWAILLLALGIAVNR